MFLLCASDPVIVPVDQAIGATAYRKHRISACRSREIDKRILQVSRKFWLVRTSRLKTFFAYTANKENQCLPAWWRMVIISSEFCGKQSRENGPCIEP